MASQPYITKTYTIHGMHDLRCSTTLQVYALACIVIFKYVCGVSHMHNSVVVYNQWNGMVEWNTGMEHWNGTLEWNSGMNNLKLDAFLK